MVSIKFLKETKKQQKLTLDELSSRSGVAKRTIEDIFQGKTKNPRIDTIQAIERALGLTVSEHNTDNSNETLAPDERELLDVYRAIKSKKGERAAQTIHALIKTYLDGI